MAKNEDEEENEAEGEEGEGGGKKIGGKKLIIIVVALVLLLGGGVAGAYFAKIGPFKKPEDEKAGAKDEKKKEDEKDKGGHGEGEKKDAAPAVPGAPVVYNLPQILVNLNTGGKGTSFLKMKIALKLTGQADVPVLEAHLPVVQDALNTYLRELRASDLSGSAGMYRLREELLLRINKTVAPTKVEDILFQEMLVQ